MCFAFGYITAVGFGASFVIGVRDLYLHGFFGGGAGRMGARGNWKEEVTCDGKGSLKSSR
jgi:hypothetical protein